MEFFRSRWTAGSVRRLPRRRNLPEGNLAKITAWTIPLPRLQYVYARTSVLGQHAQALLLEHGHAPGERADHAVGFANGVTMTGRDLFLDGCDHCTELNPETFEVCWHCGTAAAAQRQ